MEDQLSNFESEQPEFWTWDQLSRQEKSFYELAEKKKTEKSFSFRVKHEHKRCGEGFALATRTVSAKTQEEAKEKVILIFKKVFEIWEI